MVARLALQQPNCQGTTRVPPFTGYRPGYRVSQKVPVVLAYFNANLAETPRSGKPSAALQAGGRWFEPSTAQ